MSREELFNTNIKLAASVAYRFNNSYVELEDLKQEALLALWVATERFDPTRDTEFPMFAYFIIMSALQTYIYQNKTIITKPQWISRIQYYQNQIRTIIENSGILDKVDVSVDDVASVPSHLLEANLSQSDQDEVFKLKSYIKTFVSSDEAFKDAVSRASITAHTKEVEDNDLAFTPDPSQKLDIDKTLNSLGVTPATIYRLKLEGYTLREIGEQLNMSHHKVFGILKKAKQKLIAIHGVTEHIKGV